MAGLPVIEDRVELWKEQWNNGAMFQFQVDRPHRKLEEHYDKYIQGRSRAKIFFPLCGESFDMYDLAEKGHEIVGVECSELGIITFYNRHKVSYVKEACQKVNGHVYKSKDGNFRLYCCDIFDFSVEIEDQFDAIVDFGSMGALLRTEIQAYADLIKTLMKPDCRLILESFVYDLDKYPDSQPICFTVEHLKKMYGEAYSVEKIDEGPDPYTDDDTDVPEDIFEDYPKITGASYFLIRPL